MDGKHCNYLFFFIKIDQVFVSKNFVPFWVLLYESRWCSNLLRRRAFIFPAAVTHHSLQMLLVGKGNKTEGKTLQQKAVIFSF